MPQEKTLNTEDFDFTGLPSNQGKPRLYKREIGYSDSVEESIEAAGREIFKLA